jgi:rSAM/selenodomain-associated transferase 2
MPIAIVIPTLNEEHALPTTLQHIAAIMPNARVIVADGGSTDCSQAAAHSVPNLNLTWLDAPRGRGNQMNAGAASASEEVLLFLHADTLLPANAAELVETALKDASVPGGYFRISFRPATPFTSFYAALYNLRSLRGVCYGDAAIFVRRDLFQQIGGYQHALIMEDLDLVMRIQRLGRLHYVRNASVTTSSRQFGTNYSALKMAAIWLIVPLLLQLGWSQERLAALYPSSR